MDDNGKINFKNNQWRISKAFRGKPVALRATADDGVMSVFFCTHRIATIDLHAKAACGFVDIAVAIPTTPQVNISNNTAA